MCVAVAGITIARGASGQSQYFNLILPFTEIEARVPVVHVAAAASYRDDATAVISIDEWRAMSRMMSRDPRLR